MGSKTKVTKDTDHTLYAHYSRSIAPTNPTDPTETEDFSASITNIEQINSAEETRYTATITITGGKAPYTIVAQVEGITVSEKVTTQKTYNISTTTNKKITYTISDSNGNSTVLTFTGEATNN
mgnify:CR=1 FL=1